MVVESIDFVTKILQPKLPKGLLRRQRLVDFLHQYVDCRLQLVCAGAGYGKTSLLVDFAADADIPVCWYSLDEYDQEPITFFEYLIAAIRRNFPQFGSRTLARLRPISERQTEIPSLVGTLVSEIYDAIPEYFLLIFEDYHLVEKSKQVNALFDKFLDSAPDNCHVIMSSRTFPELRSVRRLVSKMATAALGPKELQFSAQDIKDLLRQRYQQAISDTEAEQIAEASEGWITGILLTTDKMWEGLFRRAATETGPGGMLFEYLVSEVFTRLNPGLQHFLLSTSILTALDPAFCDRLLGRSDSQEILNELEQRNLFVIRLEDDKPLYRYHQLFQEFLQAKLRAEDTPPWVSLHNNAAELYIEENNWKEAIEHYLTINNYDKASPLIAEHVKGFYKAGKLELASRWIDALPEQYIFRYPSLAITRAEVYLNKGEHEKSLDLLGRTLSFCNESDNWEGTTTALMVRSVTLRSLGEYDKAIDDASEALRLTHEHETARPYMAEGHLHVGTVCSMRGDLKKARRHLYKALDLFTTAGDPLNLAHVHNELGIVVQQLGDLSKAAWHYEKARQNWEKVGDVRWIAYTLNNIAMIYYWQGEYELAEDVLLEALRTGEECEDPRLKAYVLVSLADVKGDLGRYTEALDLYNEGLKIARHIMEGPQVAQALAGIGNSYRLMGDLDKAYVLFSQALTEAEAHNQRQELGTYKTWMGVIRYQKREFNEAFADLADACRLLTEVDDKRALGIARVHLGQAFFLQKQYREALKQLELAAQIADEIGYDEFIVNETRSAPLLVQYAASRNVANGRFSNILERVLKGRTLPGRAMETGLIQVKSQSARIQRVEAYGFGKGEVMIESVRLKEQEWRSAKAKEMLFFLLRHREGRTRDQILETLWPEVSLAKSNSLLHSNLYRLRRALYPDCVEYSEGRYCLYSGGEFWFDVEEFERLLSTASKLPQGCERRANCLEQATQLYRGPFLEDLYFEWCADTRMSLEGRYLTSLCTLAGYYTAKKQFDNALELLQKALDIDAFDDEANYQLILCHLQCGDRARAIRCYQNYTMLLKEEIGAQPSDRIMNLLGDTV